MYEEKICFLISADSAVELWRDGVDVEILEYRGNSIVVRVRVTNISPLYLGLSYGKIGTKYTALICRSGKIPNWITVGHSHQL